MTSDLLAHLGEVDQRRLFADLGFDSMWAFCTQSLGLCESTAWRRIAAARVCHDYPDALGLVATGELRVVALSLMRTHLNADNAAELFELCRRRSFRQVEELLAARFPKPDIRDLVRRLPARPPPASNVESGAPDGTRPPEFQGEMPTTEPEQPPQSLWPPQPLQPPAQRRIEPLSADRYGVHFTADTEFRGLLERVRALASQRLPGGDLKTVLQRGLEAYERELLDHIDPHARGGRSTLGNLRLRCRAHNLWHPRRCFGEAQVRRRARQKISTKSSKTHSVT